MKNAFKVAVSEAGGYQYHGQSDDERTFALFQLRQVSIGMRVSVHEHEYGKMWMNVVCFAVSL